MPLWLIVLIIILLFGTGGTLPHWGYHQYGYGPSIGLGTVLLVVLIVVLVRGG